MTIVGASQSEKFDTLTNERIVGGTAASILEYPYQLSLQLRTLGSHFCGAALILPDVALTAAHCLFG